MVVEIEPVFAFTVATAAAGARHARRDVGRRLASRAGTLAAGALLATFAVGQSHAAPAKQAPMASPAFLEAAAPIFGSCLEYLALPNRARLTSASHALILIRHSNGRQAVDDFRAASRADDVRLDDDVDRTCSTRPDLASDLMIQAALVAYAGDRDLR